MKYKLICCDIDGTLVDSQGRVTRENQEAVAKLKEEGVMFAICSGRMYCAVSMIGLYYNILSHAVCCNGATVANIDGDQILYENIISQEKIESICRLGEKYHCVMGFNTLEGVIFRGSDGVEDVLYHKANQMYGESTKRTMMLEYTEQYRERIQNERIGKISLWTTTDEEYEQLREEIKQIEGITTAKAMKCNLEITQENVTKWNGIEKLMEQFGLKKEEVVCIGDTMNDYEMIRNAGLGVAMENGDPNLKEIADYITDTNDNSGVAKVIRMCLEGKL